MDLIWKLLIVLMLLILVSLLVMVMNWCFEKETMARIKFSAFKKFYALNPDRWDLTDSYVICRSKQDSWIYRDSFSFGFIDFYRYKLWYYKDEKDCEEKQKAKELARMIVAVKKDIENAELTAQFQYGKAAKIIMMVGENHE